MNMKKTHVLFVSGLSLLLMVTLVTATIPTARAAVSCGDLETGYLNGQTVCINITGLITDPTAAQLAAAKPLYIAAYTQLTLPGPQSLPSGYQPLCNPCDHSGASPILGSYQYHDHVIAGGFGQHSQSGDLRELVVVAYNVDYSNQATFQPFTSAAGITVGEHAGLFQVINPGAANPFEIHTDVLVVFQLSQPS